MLEVHNTTIDPNTHVLLLKKAIYGVVQAARQCWKKFKKAMAGCNYYPSKSDHCLCIKKAQKDEPLSFVIIYVDDGAIIGTPDAIKEVISALGNSFKVKPMGEMEHFVGCKIIDSNDKDGVWRQKTLDYFYNLNLIRVFWMKFLTVKILVTHILESVSMVMYCTSVVPKFHGNLKLERVLHCHPLKLSIIILQKFQRK
jgi:Reverse transcriptase (RNA-dependent DNA polymerase)